MEDTRYEEMTLEELHLAGTSRACIVIDIRTELEYSLIQGSLETAVNIPLHDDDLVEREAFPAEVLSHIRPSHEDAPGPVLAFICRSGERSRRACELMAQHTGYRGIVNVKGGLLGNHARACLEEGS